MRTAPVLVSALLLAGCGSGTGTAPDVTGRVTGHALAGPTCPVERPGQPGCEPAPVKGVVELAQGDRVVSSATLDADGSYAVEVPVGSYQVTVDVGGGPFPMCEPLDVEVTADGEVVADISCDTGIR